MIASVRAQMEKRMPVREKIATSIDLPLSAPAKRALLFAAQEDSNGDQILTAHLLLGILRLEDSIAIEVLRNHGLTLAKARELLLSDAIAADFVKGAKSRPTACRDCTHLIVDGAISNLTLFCGASPMKAEFDSYTGEFKEDATAPLSDRFQLCVWVNFGRCKMFEERPSLP
jgi:hypothetical protein